MPTIIELRRGDDLVIRATFSEETMPVNLTGWSIAASLRFPECADVPLDAGWLDAAAGVGYVRYDKADTSSLHIGDHELRIRATSPAGDSTSTQAVTIQVTD